MMEKETQEQVDISVYGLKDKNVVRMAFSKPVSYVEFDPIACANLMRILGEKLKELSQ